MICGGIVSASRTGQGLAGELIKALRDLAPAAGCTRVIAPVRPTLKPSYPLTHIDTFAGESVIPRGLSILHIDRDEDRGRYAEPNVWIRHL